MVVAVPKSPLAIYRTEVLLLHVCYGLANKPSKKKLSATILGKKAGMFYWER